MPEKIHIAPNAPLYIALADPAGDSAQFDFENRIGTYRTTDNRILPLPYSAVLKLNDLSPRPGQQIEIVKQWSGKHGEAPQWFIRPAGAGQPSPSQPASQPADSKPAGQEPPVNTHAAPMQRGLFEAIGLSEREP